MDLKIFDVEHGACALLSCDDNTRMMIDCGHNASTGWLPGNYLRQQGIGVLEMLAVTNYDEDHVSGISNLFDRVDVRWLWRNVSISPATIRNLKSEDGMRGGIERLISAAEHVFTGDGSAPGPSFRGLSRIAYWNTLESFDDENNLSMALFLECNGQTVLFPGDLERAGWLKLLESSMFREELKKVRVLVASHHGRANGCCEEIFDFFRPYYVVVSDKGYMYDTQETLPFYRRYTIGGPFRGDERHVLTTRRDGTINFYFNADSTWGAY